MRHLLRDLLGDLPRWDRASKLSLLLSSALLILLLTLGFTGPAEIQFPARIGAFGTLLSLQLLLFWGNRRRISPYHQAQRHYLDGQYAEARDILGQIPEGSRASVDALVLLCHACRQLCQFDQSRAAIDHALKLNPDYHHALYAAGKLSLVTGEYDRAIASFKRALDMGAPDFALFDLGQAATLRGDDTTAERSLTRFLATDSDEPAKRLLSRFYLGRAARDDAIAQASGGEIEAHLLYWRGEAERYRTTAYGKRLERDIGSLRATLAAVPD